MSTIVLVWWWITEYRCEKFVDDEARHGVDAACMGSPFFKAGFLIFPVMLLAVVLAGMKATKWWYIVLVPVSASLYVVLRAYGFVS